MLDVEDSNDIEPILCGYFNKIVQSLINKVKTKLLHYILLKREGDIFIKLLSCLQHHSLAQLLIELMQVKVVPSKSHHHHGASDGASGGLLSNNNGRGFAFHENGGSEISDDDSDNDDGDQATALSPNDAKMIEVLKNRRQEVVAALIEKLSSKNLTDLESCLNAHTILSEMSDNDILFEKLVEKENLQKLINHSCDLKNPNQAWATNVLTNVIKEFPNYENQISKSLLESFKMTMSHSVADIIYTCLLMMRSSDAQLGETPLTTDRNQAGAIFKRFGTKRMRALELLKQALHTFHKYFSTPETQHLISSPILKKQILTTMLDVIETYEFSNVASQLSIQVLDNIKTQFNLSDLQTLKGFVRKHLSTDERVKFTFEETGNVTQRGHLAAIIKMALELKKQSMALAEQQSEDESAKLPADREWKTFCRK